MRDKKVRKAQLVALRHTYTDSPEKQSLLREHGWRPLQPNSDHYTDPLNKRSVIGQYDALKKIRNRMSSVSLAQETAIKALQALKENDQNRATELLESVILMLGG